MNNIDDILRERGVKHLLEEIAELKQKNKDLEINVRNLSLDIKLAHSQVRSMQKKVLQIVKEAMCDVPTMHETPKRNEKTKNRYIRLHTRVLKAFVDIEIAVKDPYAS